jgi:hypothetical protein
MWRFCSIVFVVAGCRAEDSEPPLKTTLGTSTATGATSTSTATGVTGTTGTTSTTSLDCSLPPPTAALVNSFGIGTQEDFDFSDTGFLIYQELTANAVVGVDQTNTLSVLSPGAAGDPRGIHGLSDGRIVIMSIWDGTINIADPSVGGIFTLGNLGLPNGVDVGANDRIYFSTYDELGWTDVNGANFQIVHTFSGSESGNGVALAPGETKVTVAVAEGADTHMVSLDLLGPDNWGNPTIDNTISGFYSAIEYDSCGNLYTVNYSGGELYRIEPDGTVELLMDLGTGGAYSAIRFGPGHHGWERERLYVSNRNIEVFEVHIGIPGVVHPTTP